MREAAQPAASFSKESNHPQIRFGHGPDLSAETEILLRVRLRVLTGVLLGIVLLLTLKSQIGRDAAAHSVESWSLIIVLLFLAAALLAPVKLGIGRLRAIELLVFGSSTFAVLHSQYVLITAAVESGDPVLLAAQHQHMVLPFVLLIFLYALFVPARWTRAAAVIGGITLAAIALRVLLVVEYPELRDLLSVDQTTQAGALLVLSAASSIIGSHVINGMRVQAFKSRQLGQYELIEQLGRGGMGEVWTAHHRLLARPAAVKLIRPEMLGDPTIARDLLERFEREALATAALTSPHTITVYDFGVTADRSFYYVMELLEGFDFTTLLRHWGPVPPGRVVHLIAQACDSLAEAHSRGLIHRDIKPSNLFACRIGNEVDFVKVLDFGLVKATTGAAMKEEQLTRVGVVNGTPGFMSPEQITGKDLDARSDLYALGCVAYTLLTGELVFDGEGIVMMAIQHVQDTPVPPSRRTPAPIPADLEKVVLWCLEKSPEQRPPDAATLKRSLLASSAAGEWDSERAYAWWRKHASTSARIDESAFKTASASATRQ